MTYTIEAGNFGQGVAANVVVTDKPEAGTAKIYAPSKGEVDKDGVWQVGDLVPGETARATVEVVLPADFTGELVNKADIENPANPHDLGAYEANEDLEGDTDQGDQAPMVINPKPVPPTPVWGSARATSVLSRTGVPALGGILIASALTGAGILVRRRANA